MMLSTGSAKFFLFRSQSETVCVYSHQCRVNEQMLKSANAYPPLALHSTTVPTFIVPAEKQPIFLPGKVQGLLGHVLAEEVPSLD